MLQLAFSPTDTTVRNPVITRFQALDPMFSHFADDGSTCLSQKVRNFLKIFPIPQTVFDFEAFTGAQV